MSQQGTLLETRHGHFHDSGRPLHARLPLLRHDDGSPAAPRWHGTDKDCPIGEGNGTKTCRNYLRDDLPDKGAAHWAETIREVRRLCPNTIIEILIPDYRGRELQTVLDAQPDIVGHNLETVERLTPSVRSRATYRNSMAVLQEIAAAGFIAKTGIMVGLGEQPDEVTQLLRDAREAGCRMLTIGQYLQPSSAQLDVVEYVHPDTFALYKQQALELGFDHVESGPLVRSSYMAEQSFVSMMVKSSETHTDVSKAPANRQA